MKLKLFITFLDIVIIWIYFYELLADYAEIVVLMSSQRHIVNKALFLCFVAELTANFEKFEVQVKATGSYPCEVDGRQLSKGETAILRDRGSLLLLPDKFENIVQFIGNNILGKRCAGMNEGSSFGAERTNTGSGPTKQKQAKLNFKQDDVSNSDHSDSEHLEDINKRLQKLRENATVEAISGEGNEAEVAMNVGTSSQAENSSERMLKASKPAENSVWMEHDRLLMYTAKGVLSSSKVRTFENSL